MPFEIRRGGPSDALELARLRWLMELEDRPPEQDEEAFTAGFVAWAEAELGRPTWNLWLAEAAGRVVGNVYLQVIAKVPRPMTGSRPWAYLTSFYVTAEARNAGIGTALLEEAISWARATRLEFVEVWPAIAPLPSIEGSASRRRPRRCSSGSSHWRDQWPHPHRYVTDPVTSGRAGSEPRIRGDGDHDLVTLPDQLPAPLVNHDVMASAQQHSVVQVV
jgi:GNAT superfamily N-acetyltransferase